MSLKLGTIRDEIFRANGTASVFHSEIEMKVIQIRLLAALLLTLGFICFMAFILKASTELKKEIAVTKNLNSQSSISDIYSMIHHRSPPNGFNLWVEFAKEKKCELNLSYYEQIYRDLDPWMQHESIKLSDYILKTKYSKKFESSIRKFDGSFTDASKLFDSISHLLKYDFEYLINEYDEPVSLPADFGRAYGSVRDTLNANSCMRTIPKSILDSHGFFLGPQTFETVNDLVPIFSQAKHICYKDLLVPLYYHLQFSENAVKDNISWDQKKNVLFWRGSSTGGDNGVKYPWKKFHRTRLIDWEKKWSQKHPDRVFDAGDLSESSQELEDDTKFKNASSYMVDIGFSGYCQIDDITSKIFEANYPVKKSVSFEQTMKFKYLLIVDGNTWPSRIQAYLQTNSVILYNGIFIDFYLWMLKPWVHYVPLRTDLSDLEEKMEWLLANDDQARAISENAKALMAKVGRYEHLQCYTGLMFQEYGRIFGNPRV